MQSDGSSSIVVPEKEVQLKCLARDLAGKVRVYYRDPEHRKQFSEWYKAKYGKEYDWEAMKFYKNTQKKG